MSHQRGQRVKSRSKTIRVGRGRPSVKVEGRGRAVAGRETVVVAEVELKAVVDLLRVMIRRRMEVRIVRIER